MKDKEKAKTFWFLFIKYKDLSNLKSEEIFKEKINKKIWIKIKNKNVKDIFYY